MDTEIASLIILGCLAGAVLAGRELSRLLPETHLSADTKDTVKLSMGLVATMAALLLGLLVSSAKGSYDAVKSNVTQMAAKATFLDRVLSIYGPDAVGARAQFRKAVDEMVRRMWPEGTHGMARFTPNLQTGSAVVGAIQSLAPANDTQRNLQAQAINVAVDLGQIHALLEAQMISSISKPLLVVVVSWLFVIFLSFSLLSPRNPTALLALLTSALSVSAAIFLILELDRPFGGLIQISSEPMVNALSQMSK